MEDRIRQLEIQVTELKKDAQWSRILGGTVGMLLLAFLGYTSIFQIPREVKATTAGRAADDIIALHKAASNHVQALRIGDYVKYEDVIQLRHDGAGASPPDLYLAISHGLGGSARLVGQPGTKDPDTSFALRKPR